MRAGKDHESSDWNYVAESVHRLQASILDTDTVNMIHSMKYTNFCVLTDIQLLLRAEGGWHPSYIVAFDPREKQNKILLIKRNKGCEAHTNVTMTPDKQGIICDGGRISSCGMKNLPDKGQRSPILFFKTITFDPQGADSWTCPPFEKQNAYTFIGSYYHVYIKLANCPEPRGKSLHF